MTKLKASFPLSPSYYSLAREDFLKWWLII